MESHFNWSSGNIQLFERNTIPETLVRYSSIIITSTSLQSAKFIFNFTRVIIYCKIGYESGKIHFNRFTQNVSCIYRIIESFQRLIFVFLTCYHPLWGKWYARVMVTILELQELKTSPSRGSWGSERPSNSTIFSLQLVDQMLPAGFLQMTQMAASRVGGKPRASVCMCVCVCVHLCAHVWHTWMMWEIQREGGKLIILKFVDSAQMWCLQSRLHRSYIWADTTFRLKLKKIGKNPGGSMVKNLPAVQETWVRFLGREYPLEKEMATHSSVLAWRIPWIEETGGLQSMGSHRVGHNWVTKQQQQGKPLGHSGMT